MTSNQEVRWRYYSCRRKVSVDKDFGAGYFFPVIIEDAKD